MTDHTNLPGYKALPKSESGGRASEFDIQKYGLRVRAHGEYAFTSRAARGRDYHEAINCIPGFIA